MTGGPLQTSLRRYATALAVSVLCHTLAFAVLAGVALRVRAPSPVIAVTLRSDGGGGGGQGGASSAGSAERRDVPGSVPEVARDAAPAPVAAPPFEVAPPPVAQEPRAALPRRPRNPRVDTRDRRPAMRSTDAPPHDDTPADHASAEDVASAATTTGGDADRGNAPAGGGAGAASDARGTGAGGGPGGGSGTGGGHGAGIGDGGDLRTRCADCPAPEYPPRARREGWQGIVDVRLRVASDGAVAEASVGRSSGFAVLDAAAIAVARRSRFHVATERAGVSGVLRYRFVLTTTRPEVRSF